MIKPCHFGMRMKISLGCQFGTKKKLVSEVSLCRIELWRNQSGFASNAMLVGFKLKERQSMDLGTMFPREYLLPLLQLER